MWRGSEQRTTSPAEAPSLPLGNLPMWGGAAAAFLAAWSAYARRKRLQHATEAAQERAERAARLAAQRARAAALIAAVALDQVRRRLTHPAPAEDADDEAPPLPRQTGLLIDGEVPLNAAASGRTPQPGYGSLRTQAGSADTPLTLSALPPEVQNTISILPPNQFHLTDGKVIWCTPNLCVDPNHADNTQFLNRKKPGLHRKTFWQDHALGMGSAKAVSMNLFGAQMKLQIGVGVQLDFNIPDRFLQNQEEALFYYAYRETVLAHEAFQSRFSVELPRLGRVGLTSGFSLEDLPSNHLAYIRDAKHLSLQEIANLMGGVEGGITEKDWKHVRGRLPQNRDPHMRPLVYRNGQWVFVDWPDALKPPPNPLSPAEQRTWVSKRSLYFHFNISIGNHHANFDIKKLPLPSFLSFLVQP